MVVKPAPLRTHLIPIVHALGCSFGSLPQRHVEFEARDKTLLKKVKNISKSEHLRRLKKNEEPHFQGATYQQFFERYSRPVFLRECEWGILVLQDKSSTKRGQFHLCIKLKFLPDAIVTDPLIADDISTPYGYQALDLVITDHMRDFILEKYDGPGSIDVDEGDHFCEAMVIEIEGEGDGNDHNLDMNRIAEELHKVFCDGEFDRRFSALVKKTQAIYAKYGRLKP
ncbi:hypothetical protein LMG28614_05502 [Paraburkholderia ultramafica]|uniref:Uncharacterized protein n=1 Tax=Paraburkholderia ultramafica TaxID=1544867 RepID=A0A6S7BIU8_9BURK|nr:hypothetical protein [Paraburkholderia ultramafica]CAB3801825.1 hypothetical protein LMG28614_05502 [Paraburkholderia ultramafica]